MIRLALRQGVEIASFARGAENFSELTGVPLSESALHRMVVEYGSALVEAEEQEASAMVSVPKEDEAVQWRKIPQPDSEIMAVSADGVMIHLREEGWKETKVMSVSALLPTDESVAGAASYQLQQHSYRVRVCEEAKHFVNHYWAESYRRGLEKAKQVVCVSDGALWIWAMAFLCFARRTEILDWWHMLQYLWQVVGEASHLSSPEAADWMTTQKAAMAHSQLRLAFQHIRQLFPRGQPLPEPVRQAIGYLWNHRRRMDYAAYRRQGLPLGSGVIESAAKVVVQQRMKQAGMRWKRENAQALLALRARLLSNRWHDLPI